MFFDELNNDEWVRLAALVADEPVRLNRRGRPRAETRVVANAVLWILTTGEPWSKLPGRYPSGPTCRRRFEEWLADGTLAEMVKILSEFGRSFAYIPPPPAPPAATPRPEPAPDAERLRGVFWKNPESWQMPVARANVCQPHDPFAEITRQLSVPDGFSPIGLGAFIDERADASERGDRQRGVLLINRAARAPHVEDRRDHTIYASAQPVGKLMYRAWAEIVKDGKRVERSGLIGPRFTDMDEAEQYALEWAREWIDRHCGLAVGRPQAAAGKGVPPTIVPAVAVVPATARPADAAVKRITPERRHQPEVRDGEAVSAERYPEPVLVYQVG
jgi:transposase